MKVFTRLAATACLIMAGFGAQAQSDPGNIILIVSDDQGADYWGGSTAHMPALDALAADGVRFTSAYTSSASCSPSRATMLTGQFGHQSGMFGLSSGFAFFENTVTLPALLNAEGYSTVRVGKLHLRPRSILPFTDVVSVQDGRSQRAWLHDPVTMARDALDWVDGNDDAPFFMLFAPLDPHRSPDAQMPNGANSFGNHFERPNDPVETRFDPNTLELPSYLPDLPEVRDEFAEYLSSLSRFDRGVAALIAGLRERGLYEDTLIIFASDNGAPFVGAKMELRDTGARLPLIMRMPGMAEVDVEIDTPVTFADIFPTILQFAGRRTPQRLNVQGVSLIPLLRRGILPERDAIFASHSFHSITTAYPMRMVVTEEWKLIWNLNPDLPFLFADGMENSTSWQAFLASGNTDYAGLPLSDLLARPDFELYDRINDPLERVNLADNPDYAAIRDDLIDRIVAMQVSTGDTFLRPLP